MPLWNKTDLEASRPTWIDLTTYPAGTQLVFVDATEAAAASNRTKGFKSAGWYLYREAYNSNGEVRYFVEPLVAMTIAAATSGDDTDDLTVPDATVSVAIGTQPANTSTNTGAAELTVVATLTPAGTVTYQWYRKAVGGRFVAVDGATTDTLSLTSLVPATNNGDQYRVVVGGAGAKKLTSTAATLTVTYGVITIDTQPTDQTVADAGTVTFTLVASIDSTSTITYQWQYNNAGTWEDMAGETAATLDFVVAVADDGKQYRCVVSAAGALSVNSDTVTLTVTA